jgi:hypothetical protein
LTLGTGYVGYFSGLKYTKGSAAYTGTTITIPTAPPTPGNSLVCLNFTDAGVYDASGKNNAVTLSTAKISTAQSKYAGSSLLFNGTSDYIRIPANQFFTIGSSNFTVETWIYVTGGAGSQRQIVARHNAGSALQWMLELTAGNLVSFYFNGTGGGESISSDTVVPSNQWVHVAGGINGTTKFVMLDGVYKSVAYTTTPSTANGGIPLTIGATVNPSLYFTGYIEDVRITRGAVYTANVAPPTAAFGAI